MNNRLKFSYLPNPILLKMFDGSTPSNVSKKVWMPITFSTGEMSWYASSACPPTISNHLRLCPPTLQCHSDAHCVSSHNHTTPVPGLNSDQCLISPDLVPMSQAPTYLSFSPYATFA